jgi:DNA primase
MRAGLVMRDATRRERLRQRVVIPVSRDGQSVYLMGRALRDHAQIPKFLGLDDTGPGGAFKQAMRFGVETPHARTVWVEGCFDALALAQWGVDTVYRVVALLGTAHQQVLARLALPPTRDIGAAPDLIVLDQDMAGKRAALALRQTLVAAGRPAEIVIDMARHAWLQSQPGADSADAIHVERELDAQILDGDHRVVNWRPHGDSPGKLMARGEAGRALAMRLF